MFQALKQWLQAYSARQPVLFVIEDLHCWMLPPWSFSASFCRWIAGSYAYALTFRPEFRTPWPALAHQTSLALNRLTKRQVADLMRQQTGVDVQEGGHR